MTEKRFSICVDSNDRKSLWDDERTVEEPLIALDRFGEIWGIDDCCDLLNELYRENVKLKGELAHYKLVLMGLNEAAKRFSKIHSRWDNNDRTV